MEMPLIPICKSEPDVSIVTLAWNLRLHDWGRWTEQGIGFLDEDRFPATREDCLRCALTNQGCSAECRNFYLTNQLSPEEQPYLGQQCLCLSQGNR